MIGKLSELQKEKNEQCTQRHELAVERLRNRDSIHRILHAEGQ